MKGKQDRGLGKAKLSEITLGFQLGKYKTAGTLDQVFTKDTFTDEMAAIS